MIEENKDKKDILETEMEKDYIERAKLTLANMNLEEN